MKTSKIVDALHYIDEDLVAEAVTYQPKENHHDNGIVRITEARGKETTMKKKGRKTKRPLAVAALTAVLVLGTMTVAVAAFCGSLTEGFKNMFHISEEQEEDLLGRKDGLVQIIETEQGTWETAMTDVEKKTEGDVTSATCNGITVTLMQAMVDNYYVNLSLRVDGLPKDAIQNLVFGKVQLYINDKRAGSYSGGLVSCAEGTQEWSFSLRPQDRNDEGAGWFFGEQLDITLKDIAVLNKETGKEVVQEGQWNLKWTMQGTEDAVIFEVDQELGETGAIVKTVEMTPLSVSVRYDFAKQVYQEQTESGSAVNVVKDPPSLSGVIMKDGTVYTHLTDMEQGGYEKGNTR